MLHLFFRRLRNVGEASTLLPTYYTINPSVGERRIGMPSHPESYLAFPWCHPERQRRISSVGHRDPSLALRMTSGRTLHFNRALASHCEAPRRIQWKAIGYSIVYVREANSPATPSTGRLQKQYANHRVTTPVNL